ncbi:Uncharacterised protein [Mycobacterium tuberculosis]|uniref:Uncharacterized protein n=2 Tax=Mycobacterium tuberculosis TaxID=1773 RepID=A0A0T9EEY4_MYCTX|nr:Uncharacterised protein [Mycobacterium tuberculosis]CFS12940.1 Uncharacterised protein [Mycobacterium tuberculosis]CKP88552.1 Uncharacterised protein [Mycobacterium tuberculosis]CKS80705.1 Uncharacterised protein [Mycobacterium tuberculosis]CKT08989.1 Uncharacterised protein [Mycobacterium tuberculosis]
MPPRTSSWGSPTPASTEASTAASVSINTIRPGFSACAERAMPHTAAAARSLMSSPASPTPPWVNTTNVAARSAPSQDCNTSRAVWVAAYTEPTTEDAWPPADSSSHTTTLASPSLPAQKSAQDTGAGGADPLAPPLTTEIGDHTTSSGP